jgi:hypothetical protein
MGIVEGRNESARGRMQEKCGKVISEDEMWKPTRS